MGHLGFQTYRIEEDEIFLKSSNKWINQSNIMVSLCKNWLKGSQKKNNRDRAKVKWLPNESVWCAYLP